MNLPIEIYEKICCSLDNSTLHNFVQVNKSIYQAGFNFLKNSVLYKSEFFVATVNIECFSDSVHPMILTMSNTEIINLKFIEELTPTYKSAIKTQIFCQFKLCDLSKDNIAKLFNAGIKLGPIISNECARLLLKFSKDDASLIDLRTIFTEYFLAITSIDQAIDLLEDLPSRGIPCYIHLLDLLLNDTELDINGRVNLIVKVIKTIKFPNGQLRCIWHVGEMVAQSKNYSVDDFARIIFSANSSCIDQDIFLNETLEYYSSTLKFAASIDLNRDQRFLFFIRMISLLSDNHPYEYDLALKIIIEHTTSFEILQKALLLIRSPDLKAELLCKKIRERLTHELHVCLLYKDAANISDDNYLSIKSQVLLDEALLLAQLIPNTHLAVRDNLLYEIAQFKNVKIEVVRNIADSMTMEYWENSVNSALEKVSKSKTTVNMDVPPQVNGNEVIQAPVEFGRNFKQLLSTNQLDEALDSALSLKDPERRNVFLKDLVEVYVKNKNLQKADQIVKMMTDGILKNQALRFIKDAKSSCSVM